MITQDDIDHFEEYNPPQYEELKITKGYAETYAWWDNYIQAREITIKSLAMVSGEKADRIKKLLGIT